jgi:hypothetical protein
MPMPGAIGATLDIRELADYCLNPAQPRGRRKARVFHDALGIEQSDAAWLRDVLLTGVVVADASETGHAAWGATSGSRQGRAETTKPRAAACVSGALCAARSRGTRLFRRSAARNDGKAALSPPAHS